MYADRRAAPCLLAGCMWRSPHEPTTPPPPRRPQGLCSLLRKLRKPRGVVSRVRPARVQANATIPNALLARMPRRAAQAQSSRCARIPYTRRRASWCWAWTTPAKPPCSSASRQRTSRPRRRPRRGRRPHRRADGGGECLAHASCSAGVVPAPAAQLWVAPGALHTTCPLACSPRGRSPQTHTPAMQCPQHAPSKALVCPASAHPTPATGCPAPSPMYRVSASSRWCTQASA